MVYADANILVRYGESKLDFVDCILAAYKIECGADILSFDKKLNNFLHRKEG